ncbi:MAG: Rho termination factor N-terminal domain-containing protein, partial [Alphaproteobacteria bacterium]|nr:Rho termination factor N-terminal domain-containing protein [Alphaproteobacteria bacterium]
MHVNELKTKSPKQLLKMAEDMGIEHPSQLNVQQLRFAVMRVYAADKSITLIGDGVLERIQDGFGFLRAQESNYLAGPDDLYVSPNLIKKYGLKTGDYIEGRIQAPQNEAERYFALETIERVNGDDPEKLRHRISFDDMTPLYPDEKLKMEVPEDTDHGRNM